MSMPTLQMGQPVGSPGGFKTQGEYDSAWASLRKTNQELYGPNAPWRTQQPQQPSQQPQAQPARPAAPAGGNFSAYSPGQAQSQQNPYATSTTYGQPASNTPPAPSQPSGGGQPYQAYSPANQQAPSQAGFNYTSWLQAGRPESGQEAWAAAGSPKGRPPAPSQPVQAPVFQQQMPSFQFTGGTDWMGNQYTDPNAMMAQTGAMAQALNQQRQGMMDQGQFGSLNPQMAYNQGMGMLQQGWQNPFAQQPQAPYGISSVTGEPRITDPRAPQAPPSWAISQPAQDPGNNIRDLIQGPQKGKPDPTPRLPAGMYEPERIATDRGPDWDTVYYNPSTGETYRSYKNTVRPEEGSGWVNQGRERGSQGGQAQPRPLNELSTYPGQAQPALDLPGVSPQAWQNDPSQPLPAGYEWRRASVGTKSEGWLPYPTASASTPRPGQAQPALDPYGSSTPYTPVSRPSNRPPPGAQVAQDPYDSSTPYRINDYDPNRSDYGINETMYRPWWDKYGVARDPRNGERDSDLDGVVDQSPPGGPAPVRPTNRPPPTAEELRQQQTEIKQKEAVNDLYRRAKLQPGASTDELLLGLINNTPGGTLVRPEALAGLPADVRGAVSQYQDLAGLAQSLSRPTTQAAWQRQQDVNAAVTQLKGRITERAQASQALQRDYGMSPADAAAWVNREMPMPDQAATMQGLQQKQGVYEEQERAAARAKLEKEWAATPKGPSATDQWNRIKATTNTQTKPLSPAHQRVYQAMMDEQWKARGRDDTWTASGSPIANWGRARNAAMQATATKTPPKAALPKAMAGMKWARQPDGSYRPAG